MDKELKKIIGKRLKETRKNLKLTEEQAGEAIGKKARAITSYETGECEPATDYLYFLATQNQDLHYIFTGKKSYIETITEEQAEKELLEDLEKRGIYVDSEGYLRKK